MTQSIPETDLAQRPTLESLVRTYEQAVEDVRRAFAIVHAAEATLQASFDEHIQVRDSSRGQRMDFESPDDCLTELRRQVWWAIVARLELRRYMSVAAWEELKKQIDERYQHGRRVELPEVTLENVLALAKQYESQLGQLLEQKVTEVFEWLRPHAGYSGSQYKTNQKNATLEIGPKIVLTYIIDRSWSFGWHVNHHAHTRLQALESVFAALDGQGEVTDTHYGEIYDAINKIPNGAPCVAETRYFRFRGFKNGNLHLEFRRLDLLKRLNQIAGGAALRPKQKVA